MLLLVDLALFDAGRSSVVIQELKSGTVNRQTCCCFSACLIDHMACNVLGDTVFKSLCFNARP